LKPLARFNAAKFDRDARINAGDAAFAVPVLLPAMKAHEDMTSVMMFSTVALTQSFTTHASVAMAKGAVEGLTQALAVEIAPKVRVNAIAPSIAKTRLVEALTGKESVAQVIAGMHAIPKPGEVEESTRFATFLVSDDTAGSRARFSPPAIGARRCAKDVRHKDLTPRCFAQFEALMDERKLHCRPIREASNARASQ